MNGFTIGNGFANATLSTGDSSRENDILKHCQINYLVLNFVKFRKNLQNRRQKTTELAKRIKHTCRVCETLDVNLIDRVLKCFRLERCKKHVSRVDLVKSFLLQPLGNFFLCTVVPFFSISFLIRIPIPTSI